MLENCSDFDAVQKSTPALGAGVSCGTRDSDRTGVPYPSMPYEMGILGPFGRDRRKNVIGVRGDLVEDIENIVGCVPELG